MLAAPASKCNLDMLEHLRCAQSALPEREQADKLIALLQGFPRAKLVLVQMAGPGRSDPPRQRRAIACVNTVGRQALDAGLKPTVHPNLLPAVHEEAAQHLSGACGDPATKRD